MFLNFSDSAKYAEIAKNMALGLGSVVHHSFFNPNLLQSTFFPANIPILTPYLLSLIFRVLPATDTTVIYSGFTIYIILLCLVFLLVRKLFSGSTALVSVILLAFNLFFWDYAKNFTTELIFSLLTILFSYFYLQPNRLRYLSVLPLILLFFTRQQAPIFLAAVFFTEIIYSPFRKKYLALGLGGLLVLNLLGKSFPTLPYLPSSISGSFNISPKLSPGQYLRGAEYSPISNRQLASKIFYNLYNFTKNPDRIAPLALFIFALFGWFKYLHKPVQGRLFTLTFISLGLFILAASATLPNARYIHPLLPLLIISASVGLIEMKNQLSKYGNIFLIFSLVLIILPSIGFLTLDARFRQQQYNIGKPPVYKAISDLMAANLPKNELIITNLDAWAAWYHGLTTMWFPLTPDQLSQNPPQFIFITNYLESDADFSLGEWSQVVYSPDNLQNQFLKQNYQVKQVFEILPTEVNENQSFKATILVKKP